MNTFAPRAGRTALLASLLLALLCPPVARAQASPQEGSPAPAASRPAASAAEPRLFAFSYAKGDKFRVLSEVDEEVYIDRRLSHRAEILNRIAFEVADAAPDGSSGRLEGTFVTSERQVGARDRKSVV